MQTLAPTLTCRHTRIRIVTRDPTQFVDLTDQIEEIAAESGLRSGLVNVQTLHTTTAIVVNEHEPLLLADFAALLAQAAPSNALYRHDDMGVRTINLSPGERPNGHAHCRALLTGSSTLLNLVGGRLQLGRWQRVFLIEFDGPRTRDVSVLILGG